MPVHQIQSWDTYAKWPSYGPLPHRQEVQEVEALVLVLAAVLPMMPWHTLKIVAPALPLTGPHCCKLQNSTLLVHSDETTRLSLSLTAVAVS